MYHASSFQSNRRPSRGVGLDPPPNWHADHGNGTVGSALRGGSVVYGDFGVASSLATLLQRCSPCHAVDRSRVQHADDGNGVVIRSQFPRHADDGNGVMESSFHGAPFNQYADDGNGVVIRSRPHRHAEDGNRAVRSTYRGEFFDSSRSAYNRNGEASLSFGGRLLSMATSALLLPLSLLRFPFERALPCNCVHYCHNRGPGPVYWDPPHADDGRLLLDDRNTRCRSSYSGTDEDDGYGTDPICPPVIPSSNFNRETISDDLDPYDLPSNQFKSRSDRSRFCQMVASNASHDTLFAKSILNVGFVFEVGNSSFSAEDSNGRLTGLGALSAERWSKGITAVHFVFPSDCQCYVAKTAEYPHYQSDFGSIFDAIKDYDGPDLEFTFYNPRKCQSNNFLVVLNGEKARGYAEMVDWNELETRIANDSTDAVTGTMERQASRKWVDYGFTSSQCSRRNESNTGHSMPQIKPNTTLPGVVNVFLALSTLARDTYPEWRLDTSYEDAIEARKLNEFSRRIHEDNLIPSLRLAATSHATRCGCHNDRRTNSKTLSDVVGISIINNEARLSCNGQQRKSIDDYEVRVTDQGEAIAAIEKVYQELPPSRRQVTGALYAGQVEHYVQGFPSIVNECNMDPTSYSMTVLDSVVRLALYYDLNLLEIHSLQLAYQCLPHTCLFFGVVAQIMLEMNPSSLQRNHRRGYGFGHLFATMMVDLFRNVRASSKTQDYRRFSSYKEPTVPDREQWEDMCHETTVYCLHVFAAYAKTTSSKQREIQYKAISKKLVDIWDGVGVLTASHSILQKSCLGLLPAWCRDYAIMEPENRAVLFFNERFRLHKKLNTAELDRFFKTLAQRFKVAFNKPFSRRLLENILCKAYRILNYKVGQRRPKWCDILVPGQLLFEFENELLKITYPDGSIADYELNCLIHRYPFGEKLVTMAEMVRELGLPSTMPEDKRLRQYVFYSKVMRPRARLAVEFDIPSFPKMSEKAAVIGNSLVNQWISGRPLPIPRKRKYTE